jgi:glycosyltransferase involved in cell wall biosynthesis
MKILIITADFAPRGTSCSIRIVNLVKYLEKLGCKICVVTYEESVLTFFSPYDDSLRAKVPLGVEVKCVSPGFIRHCIIRQLTKKHESGTVYKQRVKSNPLTSLMIPDPHVDAVLNFVKEGIHQIRVFRPDVLLTFGYPFTMHLVGALLKKRFPRVRWIADYGDPWTGNPVSELVRPKWREWLDYHLEKSILRYTDYITVTTEATRELYIRLFPSVTTKISVLPMGFDPDDFESIQPKVRSPEEKKRVWMVYTGRLYLEARNPLPFIHALSTLLQQAPFLCNRLKIYLVGEVEKSIKEYIMISHVKDLFVFIPWVPAQESIAWLEAADYVLLFGNKSELQIPGKVYQYLGSARPIFMISQVKDDPTIQIVLNQHGSIVVLNNTDQIHKALLSVVLDNPRTLSFSPPGAESPYSWPKIAKKFVEISQKL